MRQALLNKDIDRFLYPHYLNFLTVNRNIAHDTFYVAKVLDQPFQFGLVMTQPIKLDSHSAQEYFYYCFSSIVQQQIQKVSPAFLVRKLFIGLVYRFSVVTLDQ